MEKSGITHILWVDYIENSFTISLVRELSPKKEDVNIEGAFIEATETINRYREHLLFIIDNIEDTEDERLTSYLNCRTLITRRCEGYSEFIKVPIPSLDLSDCMNLFYFYYHGSHDDSALEKIIAITDRHTVTIELLAKIADTEETELYEFYESLVRCGFHISNEDDDLGIIWRYFNIYWNYRSICFCLQCLKENCTMNLFSGKLNDFVKLLCNHILTIS